MWQKDTFTSDPESLPRLAQQCGSAWPEGLAKPQPSRFPRNDDPVECAEHWQDDVAAVAAKTGVLTRDGGHFEAVFPDEAKAREFLRRAHELIARQLPGARLEARLFRLEKSPSGFQKPKEPVPLDAVNTQAVFDLPQAEICQLSGSEPAAGSNT